MVRAYVLFNAQPGKDAAVVKKIRGVRSVTMADVVTGPFDVVALIEAKDMSEVGRVVMEARKAGVTSSVTCVAVD